MPVDGAQFERLRDDLLRAWSAMFGELTELEEDLERLAPFFGPRVLPKHLRLRIAKLPPLEVDEATRAFEPSVVLQVGDAVVVTPEGRVLLEDLFDEDGAPRVALDRDPRLLRLYREWSYDRVRHVHRDILGQTEAMYPVALAAVLVLLLHGADSEETALIIPESLSKQGEDALFAPLDAFANIASKRNRARRKSRFDETPIGQAKRRLPRALQRSPTSGRPMRLFLEADEREEVLRAVGQAFAARDMDWPRAREAIAVLIRAYDAAYPVLAEEGLGRRREVDRAALLNELQERAFANVTQVPVVGAVRAVRGGGKQVAAPKEPGHSDH
jgi:hypothetical protein